MPRSAPSDCEEANVVAGMQTDGRLVEDVEDALQFGTELRGEADTLRFAAGKSHGGAIETEIAKADLDEEVEALDDLGKDVAGDAGIASTRFDGAEKLQRIDNRQRADLADGESAVFM